LIISVLVILSNPIGFKLFVLIQKVTKRSRPKKSHPLLPFFAFVCREFKNDLSLLLVFGEGAKPL
jgi:hypothetical protein